MREIEFRGKRVDNGEWVYGDFYRSTDYLLQEKNEKTNYYIAPYNYHGYRVSLETVGQYTGLKDSKRTEEYPEGQKIYEGDVCLVSLRYFDIKDEKAKVIFKNGCFEFQYGFSDEYVKSYSAWDVNSIEVVGNIHDNLDLLGGALNG